MNTPTQQNWQQYCEAELAVVIPVLKHHGFTLDADQPHLKGERFLMQAVTTASGRKLILFGTNHTNERVVIKATRDPAGKQELRHERKCRTILHQMKFAAEVFATPPEVAFIEADDVVIAITKYIDQVSTFLERPLAEQFDFALAAFKAQEGTHATTYNHRAAIGKVYDLRCADDYLSQFSVFTSDLTTGLSTNSALHKTLADTFSLLTTHKQTIDQYAGFLTHTDFVPHNIRIDVTGTMYLLDHSSLTFGNKYEGWARFINFMELYNPPLATALAQYVADNRTPEESLSLKLMRSYRLGEIIWYYYNKIAVCDGNLKILNQTRITFWSTILNHVLHDTPIPPSLISAYQTTRDSLRTPDEKQRQQGLH